jgi:hypothetical protein
VWSCKRAAKAARADRGSDPVIYQKGMMSYHFLKFVELLDAHAVILPEDVKAEAVSEGNKFLKAYQWLKDEAFERGEHSWRLRPKLHYFQNSWASLRLASR